jgi:Ca2+-binding RTX toxin-like protein
VGGSGNDTFTVSTSGSVTALTAGDTITGGSGTDTLTITTVTNALTGFTFSAATGLEAITMTGSKAVGSATGALVLGDDVFATIVGATVNASGITAEGVFINASGEALSTLLMTGSAVADSLTGGQKVDTIIGGNGNDTITGGLGADSLTGGVGADQFVYTLVTQSNSSNTDTITDFTVGTDKLDVTLNYAALTTALDISALVLTARAGTALIQDNLSGARGQAVYDTTGSALYINVNNDNLLTTSDYKININPASTATASIVAGDINFNISGGTNADVIVAGDGADTITGNAGNDAITGGGGADVITSGTGTDTILGGAGADVIVFAAGDSDAIVVTGDGNDTGTDSLNDWASGDLIQINVTTADTTWDMNHVLVGVPITTAANTAIGVVSSYTATTYIVQAGVPSVTTDGYDIVVNVTTDGTTAAFANAAAARAATVVNLTGTAGADTITTGANNDTITGGGGADNITGGLGADTIILAAAGAIETVFLAISTADTITGFAVAEDIINAEVLGSGDVAGESAIAANAAAVDLTTAFVGVFANGADGTGTTAIVDYTNLTEVVAFLAANLVEAATENYVAVINDLAGQRAFVYNVVVDAVTTVAGTIEVGDVALVGVVNISTAAALTTANTAFTA